MDLDCRVDYLFEAHSRGGNSLAADSYAFISPVVTALDLPI